ncbi:MAG TPA: SbcC/MukB-like Walker B domain-containing protein, partial [Candidatus Babeliales bacterium]|nr:SbcC/MukB-like Walker B domain-containing protein [Candidatus Babeliales bacterium]
QLTGQRLQQLKNVLVAQHAAGQAQLQEREAVGQARAQAQHLAAQLAVLQTQSAQQQALRLSAQQAVTTMQAALAQQQAQLQQLEQSYQQQLATRTQALASYTTVEAQQIQVAQALAAIEQLLQQAQAAPQQQLLQQQRLQTLSGLVQATKQLQRQIGDLTALTAQHQALTQRLTTLQARQLALVQQLGAYENQQTKLRQLQTQTAAQITQLKHLEQTISDYREIALALGKEGIQSLLLEEALPEIERAANQLLGRLTDHQMQLTIESLRDLKKGGAKETLEIKIMDGVGIRPYEMFSGGEAFRIDFALRIAISQLLAHRAGTSLQTLIIDEGFGSQDEEGLSYMMDAIHKIQTDFAKVIIVSHLAAIKSQFPVHFIVEKGAAGSQITVFEQG